MLILHGDNVLASRSTLDLQKQAYSTKEIINLEGKSLNLTLLKQALETKSLFGSDRLIIITNFLAGQKKKKQTLRLKNVDKNSKEIELNYLISFSQQANIILWEAKELGKTILEKFPKANIRLFKLEKTIFKFLDSLEPNNSALAIKFFRESLNHNPVEIIYSLIIRRFRLLLLIKAQSKENPDDLIKLSPWQKQRLTNQAKFFTMERLKEIYQKLLIIDYKNKTGQLIFNLEKTLELFLIEI